MVTPSKEFTEKLDALMGDIKGMGVSRKGAECLIYSIMAFIMFAVLVIVAGFIVFTPEWVSLIGVAAGTWYLWGLIRGIPWARKSFDRVWGGK